MMDEKKRERRYFTISCFSTSIWLNCFLSAAHKSQLNVGILREQFRKVLSAVYTDAVRLYINQPCLYCVSIVWWIWSVCFFRTRVQDMWWGDTLLPWKGPGRHQLLCAVLVQQRPGLSHAVWECSLCLIPEKIIHLFSPSRVQRVPTVLLLQTRAPIVIFARADMAPFCFAVRSSGNISAENARRCSPNEVIT